MVSDFNGGERHKRYKRKVADILRRHGYTVFGDRDDEIPVEREAPNPPYYLDLCAICGPRVLAIEIDGHKGHSSKRAILKDKNRFDYIKEKLKAECYRFAFYQLTDMSDELIEEELGLVSRADAETPEKRRRAMHA